MQCVWWEYSHSGMELGRMSLARHALYMCVCKELLRLGVVYTLPPYQGMQAEDAGRPCRPPGEGLPFMPPFARKAALKL